jgi:hypothetical protein
LSCKACPVFHDGRILPRLTVRLVNEQSRLKLPDTREGMRVRPDQAFQPRESARVKMPGRSREQNKGLSCGRCPPLQFITPAPCESRWQNKPSEVSFDSRRGATLETFSSRNEHSGPGARDERSCAAEQVKDARGKPLCGLPLSPTVRAPVAIVPRSENSERNSFGSRASGRVTC